MKFVKEYKIPLFFSFVIVLKPLEIGSNFLFIISNSSLKNLFYFEATKQSLIEFSSLIIPVRVNLIIILIG